jgi:hypothetical protein
MHMDFERFYPGEPSPPTDYQATLKKILEGISKAHQKRTRKNIKKKMMEREKNFIKSQKKHIQNIMEKKINWEGLTYVRAEQVITDPDEIKREVASYFKQIYSDQETETQSTTEPDPDWGTLYELLSCNKKNAKEQSPWPIRDHIRHL